MIKVISIMKFDNVEFYKEVTHDNRKTTASS